MARVRSSRSNGRRARRSARPRGRASALKAKGGRPLSNARASTRARSARAHEVRRARSGLYAPGSTPARARPMSFNAFDARRRASRSDVTRHCEWNSCFAALSQNGNAALPPFRSFSIRVREPAWTVPRVRSQRIAKKKGIVFFFQPAHARALPPPPPRRTKRQRLASSLTKSRRITSSRIHHLPSARARGPRPRLHVRQLVGHEERQLQRLARVQARVAVREVPLL